MEGKRTMMQRQKNTTRNSLVDRKCGTTFRAWFSNVLYIQIVMHQGALMGLAAVFFAHAVNVVLHVSH